MYWMNVHVQWQWDTTILIWFSLYCNAESRIFEACCIVPLIWSIMPFKSPTNISWIEKVIPWETTQHWGPSEVDTSWQAVPGCQLDSKARCAVRGGQLRPGSCSCVRCCDHLVFRHKIQAPVYSSVIMWLGDDPALDPSLSPSLISAITWLGLLVWWLVSV